MPCLKNVRDLALGYRPSRGTPEEFVDSSVHAYRRPALLFLVLLLILDTQEMTLC